MPRSSEALSLAVAGLLAALAIAGPWRVLWLLTGRLNPLGYTAGVFVGSFLGFLLHEEAHKRASARLGCVSGFVLWLPGLALTLLSVLARGLGAPLVFIAPGYVRSVCPPWSGEAWWASLAGPATNILLAGLGLAAYMVTGIPFAAGLAEINAWLALFNLLPIPPLDGYTVARRAPYAWLPALLAAAALLYIVQTL